MRNRWINLTAWVLLLASVVALAYSLGLVPTALLQASASMPHLLQDAAISLLRVVVPVACAWMLGIVCGYLLWLWPLLARLCSPLLHFLRAIPPLAWLPFAILWCGIGEMPLFVVMLLALVFPAIVASEAAFSALPREYREEGMVCGTSAWQLFWWVELPLSLVGHLQSLRILWGLAWSTLVAAEMVGVQSGLGFRLLDYRYLLRHAEMLLILISMGLLVVVVDVVLRRSIRKIQCV